MAHFVIFEKWTSNYEISISIVWAHTMCCDIANYFCQKCPILSFWERLVYFFASSILSKCSILSFSERGKCIFFSLFQFCQKWSICHFWKVDFNYEISISILCVHYVLWYIKLFLSKMPHFVILWEACVFFRFFNFVKNAQFCHFLRDPCIFSLLQFCQKCSILSFSERPVDFSLLHFCQKCSILSFSERPLYFFASSILSKMLNFVIFWENRGFVRFFNFVKNTQFCHFLRGHDTFSLFNIVKNGPFCHFLKVHFKLWDKHKYTMCTHYVLWYIKLILSKLRDFVILWEACVFFRFFNFVKNAQFCHFLREESVFFFTSSILS